MTLEHLWAGWRAAYVGDADRLTLTDAEGTLFERILHSGHPDRDTKIVHRGPEVFVILNRHPYGTGHLMVLPNRGVGLLSDLTAAESAALWEAVRTADAVLREVYEPDGINIGFNLGRAAGAGVPDHLHAHVLPRWAGDTNFTTAVAEVRVLPEPLDMTWERISSAWPTA